MGVCAGGCRCASSCGVCGYDLLWYVCVCVIIARNSGPITHHSMCEVGQYEYAAPLTHPYVPLPSHTHMCPSPHTPICAPPLTHPYVPLPSHTHMCPSPHTPICAPPLTHPYVPLPSHTHMCPSPHTPICAPPLTHPYVPLPSHTHMCPSPHTPICAPPLTGWREEVQWSEL